MIMEIPPHPSSRVRSRSTDRARSYKGVVEGQGRPHVESNRRGGDLGPRDQPRDRGVQAGEYLPFLGLVQRRGKTSSRPREATSRSPSSMTGWRSGAPESCPEGSRPNPSPGTTARSGGTRSSPRPSTVPGSSRSGDVEPISTRSGPKIRRRFRGELRPYQKEGLAWLRFLERAGLGCAAGGPK